MLGTTFKSMRLETWPSVLLLCVLPSAAWRVLSTGLLTTRQLAYCWH